MINYLPFFPLVVAAVALLAGLWAMRLLLKH